jgi:hypothetical protein
VRALVFALLLANLLFLAFDRGYFGAPAGPDAGRIEQQVAADRVRIVGHGSTPPKLNGNGKAAEEAKAKGAEPEEFCNVWNKLAPDDADRLASTLAEKFAGVRAERRPATFEGGDWWVHLPPQGGKAEADRKAGELKQLGVADYFVVQEGANRHAISLGVFSSEKGGQERLAELKAKGVKSVRLSHRNGKESATTLEVRGPVERREEVLAAAAEIAPKASAASCR